MMLDNLFKGLTLTETLQVDFVELPNRCGDCVGHIFPAGCEDIGERVSEEDQACHLFEEVQGDN